MRGRWLTVTMGVVWLASAAGAAALHTGAPTPGALDSDGDGLPDDWELHGVTVDGGAGPRFVDLPAMGADPMRPDVFLQIDWMAGAEHDQRPSPEAIRMVVEAFANAPYTSPTGSVGITLHVDAGPDALLAEPDVRWGTLSRARALPWLTDLGTAASGSYDWAAFDAIRNEPGGFAETGRGPVFHYAIFGAYHDLDDPHGFGASGNSRGIGGTDLVVTLGNFTDGVGTPLEQAGTLMHELGHNLGLRHGGCDDASQKAGYASVMNYAYQMEGVTRGGRRGVIDFSRGLEPVLDEVLLEERPALLSASRDGDDVETRACFARDPSRAGLAVRQTVPPEHAAPPADACASGEAVNDWALIRLDLGGIGRLPRRSRRP